MQASGINTNTNRCTTTNTVHRSQPTTSVPTCSHKGRYCRDSGGPLATPPGHILMTSTNIEITGFIIIIFFGISYQTAISEFADQQTSKWTEGEGGAPNFLYVPRLLTYFLGVKGSMDETGGSVAIDFCFAIVPQYIEGRKGRMWKSRRSSRTA